MDTNTDTNTEIKATPKRPVTVTVAAILLIVLTVFVAGLGIANQYGLLGRGLNNRQFIAGQTRNRNFTPPSGAPLNGQPSNGFPNSSNNQGSGQNFTFNPQNASALARVTRILRPITIALDIILLGLSIVAAIGLFMSKRWGTILAIVVAALIILLTIPGMIRIFSSVILAENLLRILLAVAVIVLLLLPISRKSIPATAAAGDDIEVERVVR